ncbi:SWIB/MDM2 domain superfamily protein [Perilla frutescens var. hirtella]|nr:SWIB/MDM2 domain superfamily protein [Perilla frutescens var. hirtella]
MASRIFGNRCRALMTAAKSAASATVDAASKPKLVHGIMKVQSVSPALAKFLGTPEASRSGAIKKIWEYVKSQNLQNPSNKKEILCDEKLKAIFDGNDMVNFQGVAKLLSNHFPKKA